ncbi:probable pectinesterase/pectinesterase inhibitor 12 [Rutidosis leptorrhynchoides]|uniref:probable pectinesterase/pectinesterase inhibitor 12 n=1 Tax=Rutidosis leptorrhynchoides TaxID=125765 RepID=UPI003A99B9CF
MASLSFLRVCLVFSAIFFSFKTCSSKPTTSSLNTNIYITSIQTFCNSTPYPDACFDSLKLSISINISPNILNFLLQSLNSAISEAGKLTNLLYQASGNSNIIEKQRGTVQDCRELHQITLNSLEKSVSKIKTGDSKNLADARAYLSAALTNKNTCLEGLDSASGPLKPTIQNSIFSTYKHVSNSLSMVPRPIPKKKNKNKNRRLLGFPRWVSRKDRRIMRHFKDDDDDDDQYNPSEVITVAQDASGNFSTITDAINFAPNNSYDRVMIYVVAGIYQENVEIPSYKTNIVLLGDGSNATVIIGSRSVADGWTTFRSATVAISGDGFLARDIGIQNTAGPAKHQATALRVNGDFAAFYRCSFSGYQDTLYVHSFRQFYRECDISGTIDYIFGNAAVVLQSCNIISRLPMSGQFTVITAQSRDSPDEDTGISIQNCSVLSEEDLSENSGNVKNYLGRPWRVYSRTVFLESYIGDFIDPSGWTKWSGDEGLDTLYYGEYENYGPGSSTDDRVAWPGYHIMDYYEASNFSASEFITADEWLDSTSFPYDDDI